MPAKKRPAKVSFKQDERALLKFALGYPEAWEDHPWGETVVKVGKKIFVFFGGEAGTLRVGFKLPRSYGAALLAPFCQPTGYGLGKSGWVTASFGTGDRVPHDILRDWIDESYRSIAPKKLVSRLPVR